MILAKLDGALALGDQEEFGVWLILLNKDLGWRGKLDGHGLHELLHE